MATEVDRRGMPNVHMTAEGKYSVGNDYRGTALERYESASYTTIPSPPKQVADARKRMDEAAALIAELDKAALALHREYKDAPKEFERRAREAVAAGKTPPSTAVLDEHLERLARDYRDTVAHREAVEAHLKRLVNEYHAVAEKHYPAWRDRLSKQLEERAEPARVALAKALAEAREVHRLAAVISDMDNPRIAPGERPRVSAVRGKQLPEAFTHRRSGNVFANRERPTFAKDVEAAARIAAHWLRIEGREPFGTGPIPESLTVPLASLPDESSEEREVRERRAEQARKAREILAQHNLI